MSSLFLTFSTPLECRAARTVRARTSGASSAVFLARSGHPRAQSQEDFICWHWSSGALGPEHAPGWCVCVCVFGFRKGGDGTSRSNCTQRPAWVAMPGDGRVAATRKIGRHISGWSAVKSASTAVRSIAAPSNPKRQVHALAHGSVGAPPFPSPHCQLALGRRLERGTPHVNSVRAARSRLPLVVNPVPNQRLRGEIYACLLKLAGFAPGRRRAGVVLARNNSNRCESYGGVFSLRGSATPLPARLPMPPHPPPPLSRQRRDIPSPNSAPPPPINRASPST